MKKKIVFIDGNLNPGGAERILCTLIRNIDREKYDVEVIITGRPRYVSIVAPRREMYSVEYPKKSLCLLAFG